MLLGSHDVRVAGHDAGGVGFERSWSFSVIGVAGAAGTIGAVA